ncbi:UDP-glycosyltransferase UGT5-like isoform X2 [Homalodisca vitripennis]|uniref:UDP-glycosyltransferase UGT5-like isoform X2 n=1 Tax=Homalodisca vitripennis TaxID=197043 RepID=UPI001EEC0461|nr:UDP-glycosyltransferase UGT5-like isoform X2 [Homalodisca vitripennis]
MKSVILWILLFNAISCSFSARILAMVPYPGKSHYVFVSAILKALHRGGHHIVEYSPFPPSKPLANYTHVEVHTEFEKKSQNWTFDQFAQILKKSDSMWPNPFEFMDVWHNMKAICEETFQHESVKKLINSNEHFDLVIIESSFGQESLLVFGNRFGAPTVTMQGFSGIPALNTDAGNALSIATIPEMTLVATDNMTFVQRLLNLLSITCFLLLYYNYQLPIQDKILQEYYIQDAPSIGELVGNVSLYLINSHPAVEYPRPYTPNIIPIAGITISPDRTPLPKDLKQFMDDAKEGVVYFSLGTVVPVHVLPEKLLQAFVSAFKKLPQKVVWKINLDSIQNLSKNVMLTKWVPQPGVLAHPNCVLFMTHGGAFSQQEAIHAAVPTVGIAFFGDQPANVKFAEHSGIGVSLAFDKISEETISTAINKVLKNPKYKENAQRLSRIFKDRPMSPADSTVFWVEYVLRHRGAHHLRSAATQLSWYQLALLDILAVFMAVIVILCFVLRRIYSLLFVWKKQPKVTKKKKEN